MSNGILRWTASACLLAWCAGCGMGSASAPTSDENAKAVQQHIESLTARVTRVPASAPTELSMAIESLESHARAHGGAYQELLDVAKEIQSNLGPKPAPQQVVAEMDRLKTKAATLQ